MKVNIYINNERLDLFEDETINLNQSVKDLKDLTKVFNDYSNNFTVPATSNNNRIFKNYYDVDIDGGFDARVKQTARIDLNGFDFREGKIQLTSVNHKKGLPVDYKIQYFSNLTSLKDLFGDDTLGSMRGNDGLNYLDNYNHAYTDTNVQSGFFNGITLNGDTAAIVYPLINYDSERRFVYNLPAPVTGLVDISPSGDGVDWTELLPSIRCHSILRAISENYGLTFSNEFFSTLEFQELYMSLVGAEESVLGGVETEVALFENAPFSSVVSFISRLRIRLFVETGFETIPYKVRVYKNDELILDIDAIGDYSNGDGTILPSPTTENADISLRVFTQQPLNFDSTEARYRVIQFPMGTTIYEDIDNRVNVAIDDFSVDVKLLMPDMKVIDWFNAIKQAFNLVIVPTGEKQFYVNDLNSWYVEGKIYDISEYIDTEVKETKRGQIYRRVDMRFDSNESFLAYFFNEQNKRQFGSLQEDILINGEKIDGDVLDVTLPFEKPIFERLSNVGAGGLTDIMYGYIVDKSQDSFNNKAFLFYAPFYARPTGQLIKLNKTTTPVSLLGNVTPSSRRLINQQSFAVNFGSEINEFDGVLNPDSFYNTFWRDYINDTMSIKRREILVKAKFPQDLIYKMQPNDRLVINGIRYLINSNKLNLTTGETSLSLLNDIFEFALPSEVTGTRIEPNEILIDHKAQDIQVTVFTNEVKDNIVAGETWQEFDQFDYLPNTPFTIGITENDSGLNRQGDVTFTFPSGNKILTIGQLRPAEPTDINPILQRVLDYAISESIAIPSGDLLWELNTYCNELETAGILAHTGAGGIPTSASDFTTSDVFVNFAYNNTGLIAFSLIDWIRLTQMTTSGGMTYTTQGWEGDGVNGFINTTYNPTSHANNFSLNSATYALTIYKAFSGLFNDFVHGVAGSLSDNLINQIAFQKINQGTVNGSAFFSFANDGQKVLTRINSTDVNCINKSTTGSFTATSTAIVNENLHLLRSGGVRFSNAGLSDYFNGKLIDNTITQAKRTATNKYLNSIGLTQFA